MEKIAQQTRMQIMNIALVQKAPLMRKSMDIFHITCFPISFLEGQRFGWEKMQKMGLDKDPKAVDKLAEQYGKHWDAFKTVIPTTRATMEKNQFDAGDKITVLVTKMNPDEIQDYMKKLKEEQKEMENEVDTQIQEVTA